MSSRNIHSLWLSLIDRSGPFLSIEVLDNAFPQGLDSLSHNKRKVRLAYDEWREAQEADDILKAKIHSEWIKLILTDLLEYDDTCLFDNSLYTIESKEHSACYKPKFFIKSPVGENIRFFIDVYEPDTEFNEPSSKDIWPLSLSERMIALCRKYDVRYALLTDGEKWAVLSAPVGANSGIATWYSRLWRYEPVTLKSFTSLLGARLCFGHSEICLDNLLNLSLSNHEEVTNTLGEQVQRAVEVLIQSLDSADLDRNRELLSDVTSKDLYESSVTVMMRLVFILCAEERGLLLLGDQTYDQFYAISTLRAQLSEEAEKFGPEILERRYDAWARLLATFRTIYAGIEHESLRLPPLGGSLFDPDAYPFLEGRKSKTSWRSMPAEPLPIDNRTVLLLLTALQVLEQKTGALTLSFKALDVEQIGHVYEGLLDSTVFRVKTITLSLERTGRKKPILVELSELEKLLNKKNNSIDNYIGEITGKSSGRIQKELNTSISDTDYGKLLLACGGDDKLTVRIVPYFNFLGTDIWGNPLIYLSNAYAVTRSADRSDSGTHYTPKILTEKIVKTALEPLVYIGPSEGKPIDDWILKSPSDILSLKICDPAMGSAAFLVQACRFLAEHLVSSWNTSNEESHDEIKRMGLHDQLIMARRFIAEKCLYGIDINPLAVELAKLSLWLVTMSKGKPFEFLDHNLKSGDSLLGLLSMSELTSFGDTKKPKDLFILSLEKLITNNLEKRLQMHEIEVRDISDVERISALHNSLVKEMQNELVLSNSICGKYLSVNGDMKKLSSELSKISSDALTIVNGDKSKIEQVIKESESNLYTEGNSFKMIRKPVNWFLEFPEVFVNNDGFDAIIGNPPFLGGRKIRGAFGLKYLKYLTNVLAPSSSANADLCAFFLLRVSSILNPKGVFALILQSSISEGDTRETGLQRILENGYKIISAYKSFPWPGKANVSVSIIAGTKNEWNGTVSLEDNAVSEINSYLSSGSNENASPNKIKSNKELTYQGSIPLGKGFVIPEQEARELIAKNKNNEDVIYKYLVGQELNVDPFHTPSKWILNFQNWPLKRIDNIKEPVANDYPDCINIIKERVYPQRTKRKENGEFALRKPLPQKWWQYGDKRPKLYSILKNIKFAFAISTQATKYIAFGRVSGRTVYSHSISILATDDYSIASLLSSNIHEVWARKYGSYNLELIRYAPTDLLETFSFPIDLTSLSEVGKMYFDQREKFMKENLVGLTGFYNLIHDQAFKNEIIENFRVTIVALDKAVIMAYGWSDISLEHGFYETDKGKRFTISPAARKSVLERLLELNLSMTSSENKKITSKKKRTKK